MFTTKEGELSIVKIVIALLLVVFIGFPLVFGTWTIISPQEVGIVTRLGAINRTLESGFHGKLPFIDSVTVLDTSVKVLPVDELAYSKDVQTVQAQATVSYTVNRGSAESLYREYKKDYETRLIIPAVKESIKTVFSRYTAQGTIDNRGKIPSEVSELLATKFLNTGINISAINITNIDFDDQYENAIKSKQVAEQKALEQINVTKQEEEKKKQAILQAEALAEKTKLEVEALANSNSNKIVEKLYAEAAKIAAEKWNGKLPDQMIPGGAVPFINLTK